MNIRKVFATLPVAVFWACLTSFMAITFTNPLTKQIANTNQGEKRK